MEDNPSEEKCLWEKLPPLEVPSADELPYEVLGEGELFETLTSDEEKLHDHFFSNSNASQANEVAVTLKTSHKTPLTVFNKDLYTLAPEGWLNDTVIFYHQKFFEEDFVDENAEKTVVFFQSFFLAQLLQTGHPTLKWVYNYEGSVCRSAKNSLVGKSPLSYEKLIFWYNEGNFHWVLYVIFPQKRIIEHFDSLQGEASDYIMKALFKFLVDECFEHGEELNPLKWKLYHQHNQFLSQNNGHDCGVYTICFAYAIAKSELLTRFTPEQVALARKRIFINMYNSKKKVLGINLDDGNDDEVMITIEDAFVPCPAPTDETELLRNDWEWPANLLEAVGLILRKYGNPHVFGPVYALESVRIINNSNVESEWHSKQDTFFAMVTSPQAGVGVNHYVVLKMHHKSPDEITTTIYDGGVGPVTEAINDSYKLMALQLVHVLGWCKKTTKKSMHSSAMGDNTEEVMGYHRIFVSCSNHVIKQDQAETEYACGPIAAITVFALCCGLEDKLSQIPPTKVKGLGLEILCQCLLKALPYASFPDEETTKHYASFCFNSEKWDKKWSKSSDDTTGQPYQFVDAEEGLNLCSTISEFLNPPSDSPREPVGALHTPGEQGARKEQVQDSESIKEQGDTEAAKAKTPSPAAKSRSVAKKKELSDSSVKRVSARIKEMKEKQEQLKLQKQKQRTLPIQDKRSKKKGPKPGLAKEPKRDLTEDFLNATESSPTRIHIQVVEEENTNEGADDEGYSETSPKDVSVTAEEEQSHGSQEENSEKESSQESQGEEDDQQDDNSHESQGEGDTETEESQGEEEPDEKSAESQGEEDAASEYDYLDSVAEEENSWLEWLDGAEVDEKTKELMKEWHHLVPKHLRTSEGTKKAGKNFRTQQDVTDFFSVLEEEKKRKAEETVSQRKLMYDRKLNSATRGQPSAEEMKAIGQQMQKYKKEQQKEQSIASKKRQSEQEELVKFQQKEKKKLKQRPKSYGILNSRLCLPKKEKPIFGS